MRTCSRAEKIFSPLLATGAFESCAGVHVRDDMLPTRLSLSRRTGFGWGGPLEAAAEIHSVSSPARRVELLDLEIPREHIDSAVSACWTLVRRSPFVDKLEVSGALTEPRHADRRSSRPRNPEEAAYAETYLKIRKQVIAYLRGWYREHECEEIADEVMTKLWQNRATVDSPPAFAMRCARNRAIDRSRSPRQAKIHIPIDDTDIDRTWASPSDVAEESAITLDLQAAVADLPPRQREVVALMVFCGMDENEVAQVLEISSRTVKRTLKKAKKSLEANPRFSSTRHPNEGTTST